MTPTIRIDEEVYSWLQEQARPFEDTPNSVLRRVAGFDIEAPQTTAEKDGTKPSDPSNAKGVSGFSRRSSGRRPAQMTGRQLNDEWNVSAKHALFHRDGCWYNNLEHFPGALFDPNGYVLFATEDEYKNCPYLNIGMQTNVNVTPGISAIPSYVRKRKD